MPDLDSTDRELLLEDVLARERMAGTGLGHGFALPHPRKPPKHLIANQRFIRFRLLAHLYGFKLIGIDLALEITQQDRLFVHDGDDPVYQLRRLRPGRRSR